MSLGNRLVFSLILIAVLCAGLALVVGQPFLSADAGDTARQAVGHMLSVSAHMNALSLSQLESSASAYAQWDGMRAYAESPDPEFTRQNFNAQQLARLGVDYVCIFSADDRLQFSTGYDPDAGKATGVPAELCALSERDPLLLADGRPSLSGIVLTSEGPLQVSSQRITGESGVLIFARKYDLQQFQAVASPGGAVEAYSLDEYAPPEGLEFDDGGRAFVATPDGIVGYLMLADIYGYDAVLVKASEPYASASLEKIVLLAFAASVLTGAALLALVYLWLFKPISHISSELKSILSGEKKGVRLGNTPALEPLTSHINLLLDQSDVLASRLASSEAAYASLIDGLHDPVALVGRDGRIAYANRAFEDSAGAPRDSLKGKLLGELVQKDSQKVLASLLSGNTHQCILRLAGPNGKVSYLSVEAKPSAREGEQGLLLLVAKDITRETLAQNELDEERSLSAAYFSGTPAIMLVLGADGRIISLNGPAASVFGIGKNAALGKGIATFIPRGVRKEFIDAFKSAVSGKARKLALALGKDGEKSALISISPVRGKDGKVHSVLLAGEDISAESSAKEALKECSQLNSALLSVVPVAICAVDSKLKITYANGHFARMLGLPLKKILSKKIDAFVAPSQRKQVRRHLLARSGGLKKVVLRVKKGKQSEASFACTELKDGRGRRIGAVACLASF
ncbi:MAG: PAS domain-containing protein [Candidatus Micrarchaeota archaeon]|nr:PAS domain-containing protein [Candidatus Micrarchaeota archaeon]